MKQVPRSTISDRHITRRLSAACLVVGGWLVLAAAVAAAKTGPDDSSPVLTGERGVQARPGAVPNAVISSTDSVPWTGYLVIAVIACLIGVLATLAIEFLVNRRRRISMAGA